MAGKQEDLVGISIDENEDPQTPFHQLMHNFMSSIEDAGGQWTSAIARADETPPSGAIHFLIEGKRYIMVLHPLDMPDRAKQ
jgi:hypothetical protein